MDYEPQFARAGEYLQHYENQRYTLADKLGLGLHTITVPVQAETFGDVSFWDASVRWDEYRRHARAAIVRLGQGMNVDSEFEYNYKSARENGVILGGYHFYDDRINPIDQAARVKSILQGKALDMELFVDWENSYGGKYTGLANVVAFMKNLDSLQLPVKEIGLYTGYYWFLDHTKLDAVHFPYLKTKPLWLAWYANPSIVKLPAPWTTWRHWQFGTPTINWGQPTAELDINTFNGTAAEFTSKYTLIPLQHTLEVYLDKTLVNTTKF